MMIPDPHQIEAAEQGYRILKEYAICYFAMEERTGKTLSALLVCEMANVQRILVVTKKGKPLDGWLYSIKESGVEKHYDVINYHSIKKVGEANYDLVILDEAHNYISGYPKRSAIWEAVHAYTRGLPIIYISATPNAQTPALLYHQFALSSWSPWKKYSTFYAWHKQYGTGETKWIYNKEVKCYDKVQDTRVLAEIDHLFITKTRKEIGFVHEPEDKLHYVELSEDTKLVYNALTNDNVIEEPVSFIADTVTLLRTGLHQLEGGTLKTLTFGDQPKDSRIVQQRKEKVKDEEGQIVGYKYHSYYILANQEKIEFIKEFFGDSDNVAIMYHYIGEGVKLDNAFKHAHILQATTNAEGVDLSGIEHLIIYSQDFSTARHSQRRARQANRKRGTPITVHYLLVKGGISEQVYNTVSVNKVNYIDSRYIREEI